MLFCCYTLWRCPNRKIPKFSMCTTYCLMSEVWHELQIWQGRCYWLLTVYVPGVWGQKVPIKQWKAIQRWKNASHQYWIRNNYDESIMDTRLEAQLVKNLRKGKGNPHLSVCSASNLAWFLELCTIGSQRTCSTCSSQKKEEIDFARAALSRIQKGFWNEKVLLLWALPGHLGICGSRQTKV